MAKKDKKSKKEDSEPELEEEEEENEDGTSYSGESDEADDDFNLISDLIKTWVKKNSFNNVYRLKSSTDNRMEFDLIKIPCRTEDNMPYSADDFSTAVRKAVLTICKNVSNTMGDGSRVDGTSAQVNVIKGTISMTMPALR